MKVIIIFEGGGGGVGGGGAQNAVVIFISFQCRGEASHLLFQPGYVQVLKQMALSGQLQMYNIRSVAWRVS